MFASLIKFLPFLQMLLEVFKPGEGERVTRAAKITSLAFTLLLVYSGYVSYMYVLQYHLLVSSQSHDQYMEQGFREKKDLSDKQADQIRDLYKQLFVCYETRPYDGAKVTMPPAPIVAPEVPVHAGALPEKKREVAKRPVGIVDNGDFRQKIMSNLNEE